MKRGIFTIFITIISSAFCALFAGPIDKLNQLDVNQCLQYTLEGKTEGTIATVEISLEKDDIHFYGCDGIEKNVEENRELVFEIGSLTKTFTAALICKAQQEGLLNIDDSISKYLDLGEGNFYPTIKSLLTHTSGYAQFYLAKGMTKNHLSKKNDFYGISKDQILDQVRKTNLVEGKAYDFEYSNFGYAVLGLVLEQVYKCSYTELVNNFAQADLGMKNTKIADGSGNQANYWDWAKEDGYLCAGALYSTVDDMIIYAKHQLKEEGVFAECHKMFAQITNGSAAYKKMGIFTDQIGYAWILDNTNIIYWHNGGTGSYNCYLGFNIENQKAVIVLSNLSPNYKIPATVVGTKLMKKGLENE